MTESDTKPNVISSEFAKALIKATKEMGGVKKGASNPFFKSKYADLTSVLAVIRKPLEDNGIVYMHKIHPTVDVVTIESILIYETGETYSAGTICLPLIKKDAQGVGSTTSYGRRYLTISTFNLPMLDDDGNHASGKGSIDTDAAAKAEQLARVAQNNSFRWKYDLSTMPEADLVTAENWMKLNGGTLTGGHCWEHVRDLKNLAAYRVKM
jgi:hypothetical protein